MERGLGIAGQLASTGMSITTSTFDEVIGGHSLRGVTVQPQTVCHSAVKRRTTRVAAKHLGDRYRLPWFWIRDPASRTRHRRGVEDDP